MKTINQYSKDYEIEEFLQELGGYLGRLRRAYSQGGKLQDDFFARYCKPLNDLNEKAGDEYFDLFDDYHQGAAIDSNTTAGKLHKYQHWGDFDSELGDKFAIIGEAAE